MLFNSDGVLCNRLLLVGDCTAEGGECSCCCCWCNVGEWFGETDNGLVEVVGELDGGLARGLVLKLLLLTEFEPGVTASKADPRDPGRLYGEKRCPFRPCIGEMGPWFA